MAARHDDRAGGGEHTPDAAADRDLGAGDLSGGGTAHLAHAPPAIHPGMHVREAAAIRYGLKNLGFAPRGEAGRLITNGMSRSAMRFPLAARDVVWNRCELSRSARDLAKVGNPPQAAVTPRAANSGLGSIAPTLAHHRSVCNYRQRGRRARSIVNFSRYAKDQTIHLFLRKAKVAGNVSLGCLLYPERAQDFLPNN